MASTSITESAAKKWISTATARDTLFCKNIQGFHLFKTQAGASWRYRYYDDHGKLKTVTIAKFKQMSPAAAADKALRWRVESVDVIREREQQKKERIEAERLAQSRTLSNYLNGIYTAHLARRKSGKSTYRMIEKHFSEWLDRDLSSFSRSDVSAWQVQKENDGLAYDTIRRVYGALKALINHAVKESFLDSNPIEKVNLKEPLKNDDDKLKAIQKKASRRLLSSDEIQSIFTGLKAFDDDLRVKRRNSRAHGKPDLPDLDAVTYPHWFHPFTLIALYTGLRTGDIFSLDWMELNLRFKRLVKMPEKTSHHEKPAEVVMTLPGVLVDALTGWWEQQGRPESGLVFPSPKTGGKMDKNAHDKPWRKVKELAGLPDDLVFYSLRHNFISKLLDNGESVFLVAQLAGHKNTKTIQEHYAHLCPDTAASALDALSQSFQQRPIKGEQEASA